MIPGPPQFRSDDNSDKRASDALKRLIRLLARQAAAQACAGAGGNSEEQPNAQDEAPLAD